MSALTTYGSPIFSKNVVKKSDATVRQLETNGAIGIAKSNVPEWAGGHTFNPVNGITRNPWDLRKSAGGSSGGSSAALASGSVWLATGNDLGGSLRTPAAFNGIVGLRPGPGRVPRGTRLPSMDTLWVEGPMARNIDDLALMLDASVGHQIDDPQFKLYNNDPIDIKFINDVSNSYNESINHFQDTFSCENVPSWDIDEVISTIFVILTSESAAFLDKGISKNPNNYGGDVKQFVEMGKGFSSVDYINAQRARNVITQKVDKLFDSYDFFTKPSPVNSCSLSR